MNLYVNTKSCFLTGWYEVRSNNPFGGTNRIRCLGYDLSPEWAPLCFYSLAKIHFLMYFFIFFALFFFYF